MRPEESRFYTLDSLITFGREKRSAVPEYTLKRSMPDLGIWGFSRLGILWGDTGRVYGRRG